MNTHNGIVIGRIYEINSPESKNHGRMVEVLSFIYDKDNDFFLPMGMKVRYMDTNRKGTHYNFGNLECIQ